jgi:two-component system CheB/CheR fusion protein
MDLDRFKDINDTFGHVAGDQVLAQLANCLRAAVRERDTLARLGGDEFVLLMEHCSIQEAGRIARTLHDTVSQHSFTFAGQNFMLGISIGVVKIDGHSKDIIDVVSAADAACYLAKRRKCNGIFVQHPDQAVVDPYRYRLR